jgi:hypothetical protein
MIDENLVEEKRLILRESRLWAWVLFSAAMVPVVMHPGNLGPIAIAVGWLFIGLPVFYVGNFLGKVFWPPRLIYRAFLVILAVVIFGFMFVYVKTH